MNSFTMTQFDILLLEEAFKKVEHPRTDSFSKHKQPLTSCRCINLPVCLSSLRRWWWDDQLYHTGFTDYDVLYFSGSVKGVSPPSPLYRRPVIGIWSHMSFKVIVLFLNSEPWSINAYLTNSFLNRRTDSSGDFTILSQMITWFKGFASDSYSATTNTNNCFKFQWKAGERSALRSKLSSARSTPPWFRNDFNVFNRSVRTSGCPKCKYVLTADRVANTSRTVSPKKMTAFNRTQMLCIFQMLPTGPLILDLLLLIEVEIDSPISNLAGWKLRTNTCKPMVAWTKMNTHVNDWSLEAVSSQTTPCQNGEHSISCPLRSSYVWTDLGDRCCCCWSTK